MMPVFSLLILIKNYQQKGTFIDIMPYDLRDQMTYKESQCKLVLEPSILPSLE